MPLYEFYASRLPPNVPVRKKSDVLEIAARWEEIADSDADSWIDFDQLDEDMHALAAVALEALPD